MRVLSYITLNVLIETGVIKQHTHTRLLGCVSKVLLEQAQRQEYSLALFHVFLPIPLFLRYFEAQISKSVKFYKCKAYYL